MTKRKRSADGDETMQIAPKKLDDRQLLNGLSNIWYDGSVESYNFLVELFNEFNKKYRQKKHHVSIKHDPGNVRQSRLFTVLQNIAEKEQERDDSTKIKLPQFEIHPMISSLNGKQFKSLLQHRYQQFLHFGSPTGWKSLPKNMQKYYLFVTMQEYEMEHGSMDEDYGLSMVGDSCWTPTEKRKFFMAVERCSRGDVVEISRRLGPTKTVVEVAAYLNLLDSAAKAIGDSVHDETYSAREMSNLFIIQEHRMAAMLEDRLETESFAKHQALMDQEIAQKSLELFNIWNFSSLTRMFAGINDMTVLCSTFVQYHQLVKQFVQDIIKDVYIEMLENEDKTVSRSMINHIIAKRKYTWANLNNKEDVRLKNLDIMAMLDGRKQYHKPFSEYRSASFLAKKRRLGWQNTQMRNEEKEEKIIKVESDSNDTDTDDSDDDEMMKGFDEEDELTGVYIQQDDKRQHLFDDAHAQPHDTIDVNDTEDEDSDEDSEEDSDEDSDEGSDEELATEERMQELDVSYELELTRDLQFHDVDAILSHQPEQLQ